MNTLAQSTDTQVNQAECTNMSLEQIKAQEKKWVIWTACRSLSKYYRELVAAAMIATSAPAFADDAKDANAVSSAPVATEVAPVWELKIEWMEQIASLSATNIPMVSLIELSQKHLKEVREGKVIGNSPILKFQTLDVAQSSQDDRLNFIANALALATPKTAKELALSPLTLVKKTVDGKEFDSISVESFNDIATKVSDTSDVEKWLQVWAPEPQDRKPASPEDVEKHKAQIANILQEVWLKNVDKWDSDIVKGKLNPEFYPDFVALINNALENNQYPSVESFRRLVTASIEIARGQNFPDTKLGTKLYDKSLSNISDALATYLVLTTTPEKAKEMQLSLVKTQIGELKYTLPAYKWEIYATITEKSTKTPSLFVAKVSQEHDQYVTYHNDAKNRSKLDEESKKIRTELAKSETELAKSETELAFITEANQVQKDLYKNLQEYLETNDESKLENIRKMYAQLQDLNQRAKTEYSNDEVKQRLLALAKMCEMELKDKLNPVIAQAG